MFQNNLRASLKVIVRELLVRETLRLVSIRGKLALYSTYVFIAKEIIKKLQQNLFVT